MSWLSWTILSALAAGLTAVLAKCGVQSVNPNLATAIRTSVVLIFAWLVALPGLRIERITNISSRAWLFLVASGIATGTSWLCYFRALQLGPVSKVAPVEKLSVVVAMLLGVLLLGERLGGREIFGVALIVAGAVTIAWK